MDLAVELPTYQRSDLFAYNTNIIDETTLTPAADLTPYNGPMAKLWEVGLKETDGSVAAGNNSTVIIIVVVALVVVAGAGVGVFFVLKNKKAKAAPVQSSKSSTSTQTQMNVGAETFTIDVTVTKETPKADEENKDE